MKPLVYAVRSAININPVHFGLPKSMGNNVYIIEFGNGDLTNPSIEPILIEFTAGNRQYYWRNAVYNEVNISKVKHLKRQISVFEADIIMRKMDEYWNNPPPMPKTELLNDLTYCRVIYKNKEFK